MDISLNSSAILVIIVGLWLVWVVPFFLRRQDGLPGHQLALARNLPAVNTPSLSEDSSSQGNILENTSKPTSSSSSAPTPAAAPVERGGYPSGPSAQGSAGQDGGRYDGARSVRPFKIRYGRTALAGIGALALLTALATTVISVIGLLPAYVPILSLLVAVGSVAALRTLAIRDRSKRSEQRVQTAFREAMNPGTGSRPAYPDASGSPDARSSDEPAPKEQSAAKTPKRETKLFDAESPGNDGGSPEASGESGHAPTAARTTAAVDDGQRWTADDLRKAALEVAAESESTTDESGQPWQPVDVPKPKYVESAKADRPAPEPLELPAEPKPEGKPSIKAGAAAPKAEMKLDQEAVERTAEKAKPSGALHDLDNVLQRRRA